MTIKQLYQLFLAYPNICTDTRSIRPNSLFFALRGYHFDANNFALQAIEQGCKYAIVDNPILEGSENIILVDNVLTTLQELATYHRRQLNIPILAITGTNGKTTTKELIGKVLSSNYNVGMTSGNFNNHIGVPLTLLSMNEKTEIGVVEMGANHLHEIAELCQIAQPNYGLITNIGKAHLEGFGSLENIKKTKGELYDYLNQSTGTIFVNQDDPVLKDMASQCFNANIIAYPSDLSSIKLMPATVQDPFLNFTLNNHVEVKTQLLGNYNLNNVLAAMSVGRYFNISLTTIINSIAEYCPTNNRSQFIKTDKNVIYMDAYNANPSSMSTAIHNFAQLSDENKVLILGDMLELGKESLEEHQKIIDLLIQCHLRQVIFIGNIFYNLHKYMPTSGFKFFRSVEDFKINLSNHPINQQIILVKGSRGLKLEESLSLL